MADVQWKDLKDVRLEQNVLEDFFGSNLVFQTGGGQRDVIVYGIPSAVASTIYAKAQYEEQVWEEKRRVRSIEEVRAAASGVIANNAPASGADAPAGGAKPVNHMLEQIQKAKELLDMGAVSDAEFQEMNAKILGAA